MAALRKPEPVAFKPARRDCIVDFSEEVTDDQIKRLEDLVSKEFENDDDWVTVEQDS